MKDALLEDVFIKIRNGASIKQDEAKGGIPITRIETIANEAVDFSKVGYADIKDGDYDDFFLQENDILMSHINSWKHLGKTAIVENLDRSIIHGMNLLMLRADQSKLFPKYSHYFFKTEKFRKQLDKISNQSVNQSSFSTSGLKKIRIPLPALLIQKKIADTLDKADALRRKNRQLQQKYDELAQSIFYDMFGDSVANENGWVSMKVSTVADVQGGLQLFGGREAYPLKRPYLRVANVYRNRLNLSEIKYLGVTENEFNKTILLKDDILIVEGHGNKDEIGRCAVWDGSIDECIHQNHIIRLRVNKDKVLPNYMSYFLNSDGGRRQMFSTSNTTSGLNTISTGKIRAITIFVPPINLQMKFSEVYDHIQLQKAIVVKENDSSNSLFQALSQLFYNEH